MKTLQILTCAVLVAGLAPFALARQGAAQEKPTTTTIQVKTTKLMRVGGDLTGKTLVNQKNEFLGKVEDMREIAGYGVMRTPGVVIDGKVVHAGGLPKPEDLARWLVTISPPGVGTGQAASPSEPQRFRSDVQIADLAGVVDDHQVAGVDVLAHQRAGVGQLLHQRVRLLQHGEPDDRRQRE